MQVSSDLVCNFNLLKSSDPIVLKTKMKRMSGSTIWAKVP